MSFSRHYIIDSFTGRYDFLSNFYPVQTSWRGIIVPTVEHAYQAEKCKFAADGMQVARTATPALAKALAKTVAMRSDWEIVKLTYMWGLVCEKFCSNEQLRENLLATGKATLIEGNTWGDTYWGVCNGKGFNHLGQLLMLTREICAAHTEI